jgi:hypothetical protein
MFENFKPTKAETKAIDAAWSWLMDTMPSEHTCKSYMLDERRGYNRRDDKIPEIAAKGLCLKWFMEGVARPRVLLRDFYNRRPAAVWFTGLGAERAGAPDKLDMPLLVAAVAAYVNTYERMTSQT